MKYFLSLLLITLVYCLNIKLVKCEENEQKKPNIVIVTLIRNKAHILPYFLTYLEHQNYPKNRISLWFRSDHNEDHSIEIVNTWLNATSSLYHSVDFKYEDFPTKRVNETSSFDWSDERFQEIIRMKQEGLNYARRVWADYVFFLDADVLLSSLDSISNLIELELPIVAPMILSDGLYSNFWAGMDDDYYYKRTDEYKTILEYEKIGNWKVPMIHTAVLINLNYVASDYLTFDNKILNKSILSPRTYNGPVDDIIIFAMSAKFAGLPLYVSNQYLYGYITVPVSKDENIYKDMQQLTNLKTIIIAYSDTGLFLSSVLQKYALYPEKDTMTLSRIFMINLVRRPERKIKMEQNFRELGLEVEYFPAVDGRNLTEKLMEEKGLKFLPSYADPFHKRPMTMGEIGCFLSHYNIWEKVVEQNLTEVLILEDDIKFEPFFKVRTERLLDEARKLGGWDFIYFGRKRLHESDEKWVEGTENLVTISYSYWTLGYLLTLEGAKKLIAENPLQKLIPIDEYLPIMFNIHPNDEWKNEYINRSVVAYSVSPLLIYPTHYTGEEGYISDTEDSIQITVENFKTEEADIDAQKKGDKENLVEKKSKHDILFNSITENIKDSSRTEL